MYKALGIVLIFFSSGIFSYKAVQFKKQQLYNLKEFKKALSIIKDELVFSIPEIIPLCKKISLRTTGEISKAFEKTEKLLRENKSMDFFAAWKSQTHEKQLFSERVMGEITNFCESFGKKTVDIEIENIKRCQKNLERSESEEKEKYLTDRKLIYSLTTAIGAVIVILGI